MSNRIILCLGPHRTGTSLVAAALQALGAELALGDVYANEDNTKGFFEQPQIVDFNDRLLVALDGAWDHPAFTCPQDIPAVWKNEAVALVQSLFSALPLAAVKDPRMCILMPFWRDVLTVAGYAPEDILCVHVLRDPVEAALSQQIRSHRDVAFYEFGRDLDEGAALWLSYTGQAMVDAARHGGAQMVVDYAGMLADPAAMLARMAAFVGTVPDAARLADFSAGFVDPALHRSHATDTDRAAIDAALPQARAAFAALQAGAGADAVAALWEQARPAIVAISASATGRLASRLRDTAGALDVAAAEGTEAAKARDSFAARIPPLEQGLKDAEQARDIAIATREELRAELENLRAALQGVMDERTALSGELARTQDTLRGVMEEREALKAELARRQGMLRKLI